MIKIVLLNYNEEEVFTADSIYESLKCNNPADGIRRVTADFLNAEGILGVLCGNDYFVRQEQPLNKFFVQHVMAKFDLILPYEVSCDGRTLIEYMSSEEQYGNNFGKIIYDIKEIFPEFSAEIDRQIISDTYLLGNRVIGNAKTITDFYRMIQERMPQIINDDILLGIVMRAWILVNNMRVRAVEIRPNKSEVWNMGYQKIELVRKYMQISLKDYIELRKQEGFLDSFAGKNPYNGDFEGKNPIWVCWWQGESEMPEIVHGCIDSLKKNASANSTVILITLDNCSEYVTFTGAVIEKFNRGIITYTHLSDLLRAELLYRYGGLWIDATYYVSHRIPEDIFEKQIYSIAFNEPLWGMDIMRGRWTLSLIEAKKSNIAIQFLLEGLWVYWENADELVDYFTVDYVFDTGYSAFEEIRDMVDGIEKSPAAVYDLQLKMNQRIDSKDIEWLKNASLFYKLNRRNEYHRYNSVNDVTFFGFIMGEKICCSESTIYCGNYMKFIETLREINPKKVYDEAGYLKSRNRVSRGIIDEILDEDIIFIEASEEYSNQSGIEEGIYVKVIPDNDEYDCIITARN